MVHTVPTPACPHEPLRELLAAVLEALNIPHPATVGDSEAHGRIVAARVMDARVALEGVLQRGDDPAWSTDYLRARLAEKPATGYTTVDQARTAPGETQEREAVCRSVDDAFPVVAAFLDRERAEDLVPSFGPSGVQNVHDDAPTPYAVVRLDYQVTRQELFAALVFGFTETNPDRDPDGMTIAAIRREVESYLAASSTVDLSRAVEQVEAGAYTGAQLRRLDALERAMGRAYPQRGARGGDAR